MFVCLVPCTQCCLFGCLLFDPLFIPVPAFADIVGYPARARSAEPIAAIEYISHHQTGLEMVTNTVANVTKMVRMVTRSFQAVGKLATSSK